MCASPLQIELIKRLLGLHASLGVSLVQLQTATAVSTRTERSGKVDANETKDVPQGSEAEPVRDAGLLNLSGANPDRRVSDVLQPDSTLLPHRHVKV